MTDTIQQLEDNKQYSKEQVEAYIQNKLYPLHDILASIASSDFSNDVPIPQEENEFSELYVSIQLMIDVIREHVQELEEFNQALEDKVKEKVKELAESNEMNEAILSNIGDGLIVMDDELKILSINSSAKKMLSVGKNSLEGVVWPAKYTVTDQDGNAVPIKELPVSKALEMNEVVIDDSKMFTRADGTRFYVAITASPIIKSDEVVGAIVVFRDITLEKEIDQAKSEFVSLASHQLRAPLSTISWYVETILDGDVGEFDEEVREYLEQIFTSSDRLSELVSSLLDVSRLELGTFAVEPEMVDLVDIAQPIVAEMQPTIDGRKIEYQQDFQDDLPQYRGDPQLLGIIFQNLISNAVKYTPDGGKVNVSVKVYHAGETFNTMTISEDSVGISVADSGYGIPSYEQGKIFQKLFRAENVKSQKEGTGLGLYIVKSIIEEVGGNIWFESEENVGTTFYVTLPLKGMEPREGAKKLGS